MESFQYILLENDNAQRKLLLRFIVDISHLHKFFALIGNSRAILIVLTKNENTSKFSRFYIKEQN